MGTAGYIPGINRHIITKGGPAMDDHKQLNDYLEAILNLQCEDQETLKALGQESSQLLQKVQEINARVAGLQMEVMEVQDALHPP